MFSRVRGAIANVVTGLDSHSSSNAIETHALGPKFPYQRPHFLNLNVAEEVPLSADHRVRPIIVPRERDALPWAAGYAECVNAGKSLKNEDQATVYEFSLSRRPNHKAGFEDSCLDFEQDIHVKYFGLFDGHAGFGAAVCAARQLHYIIEEKLLDVVLEIWSEWRPVKVKSSSGKEKEIKRDALIIGALEKSFLEMDQLIAEDRDKYLPAGGCTALVVLFILGRVYVANAGDSRCVYCKKDTALPMSADFTPESEKSRIRKYAEQRPDLLFGEYTWREYQTEPTFLDLGKQILYKDAFMVGWAMKTLTKEDLRIPVISGDGKRSRLMNTIGVTRGFGDHDLKAINSKIPIKPFLSAHPEVNVLNISEMDLSEHDILVMGTDGLWDVTSNDKAAEVTNSIITQFMDEKHKYISAAQALVANARGKPYGEAWRLSDSTLASGDDISVFVIPLLPHKLSYLGFYNELCGVDKKKSDNNKMEDGEKNGQEWTKPKTEKLGNSKPINNEINSV